MEPVLNLTKLKNKDLNICHESALPLLTGSMYDLKMKEDQKTLKLTKANIVPHLNCSKETSASVDDLKSKWLYKITQTDYSKLQQDKLINFE